MADVSLRGLTKTYEGHVQVIRGIDLHIPDGEFAVFVGPSGCGKSTTLRMIAGLEDITDGELAIGGRVVNDLPAARRGVAMVFQSYALYPHMTVAENMGFSLKLAGHRKAQVDEAVQKAARVLRLEPLLQRKPKALSGGQRQRVAIGRAIVRQPEVFLFDEPLSNLDAALRVQMRSELAELHRELRTTMIYVTHDQVEAMTLGQRIAVFNAGVIEQCGTPQELYERPSNLFVASFIGSSHMNMLPVRRVSSGASPVLELPGGVRWSVPAPDRFRLAGQASEDLWLGIRPEHANLVAPDQGDLRAVVSRVEYLGGEQIVHLTLQGGYGGPTTTGATPVLVRQSVDGSRPGAGDALGLRLDAQRFHLFGSDGRSLALN